MQYSIILATASFSVKSRITDWLKKRNELSLIGVDTNGYNVMQKVALLLPDIVIVDKNLPFFNGRHIIKKIHSLNLSTKIITLFQCDEQEMSLYRNLICIDEATDYELDAAYGKALDMINNEPAFTVTKAEKEAFVSEILSGVASQRFNEILDSHVLNIRNGEFRLVTVNFPINKQGSFYSALGNVNMLFGEIDAIFKKYSDCESCILNERTICILINMHPKLQQNDSFSLILHRISLLVRHMEGWEDLMICACDSGIAGAELSKKASVLTNLSKISFFTIDNNIIFDSDFSNNENNELSFPDIIKNTNTLFFHIENRNEQEALEVLHYLFFDILDKKKSWKLYQFAANTLISYINHFSFKSTGVENPMAVSLQEHKTLSDAYVWFKNRISELFGIIKQAAQHPIIRKTYKYIKEHFKDEITLGLVADSLSITPVYLSRIISQYTDKKFPDIVSEIRVHEACKLLAEGKTKIQDVAYQVGFTNPKYFSQIFKKVTNLTPRQYKTNNTR